MALSRESSPSEGEIVETTNKANIASSQARGPAIDKSDRVSSLDGTSEWTGPRSRNPSRSPSPYRRKPGRSPSPYRHSQNRSPSPYRHDRDVRGREGKHLPVNKRKASPPGSARPEKRHDVDRGKYHSRGHAGRHDTHTGHRHSHSFRNHENGRGSRQASWSSHAEIDHSVPIPMFQPAHLPEDASRKEHNGLSHTTFNAIHADVETKPVAKDETDYTMALDHEDKAPSEESREEKKRRWAAKRAQLVGEATNLLQRAVLANASESTTPNVGSPEAPSGTSVSPPAASPGLPELDSAPASPGVMIVDKQEALSRGASPSADSPSAANYDPTEDMLQDRVRAEKRAQRLEMPASSYDETDPRMLSTLPAEKARPAKKNMKKKEIDMFAFSDEEEEEDDDDAGGDPVEEDQNNSVKGTVLDAKLLDNWDDSEGYYKIISNELVNGGRYRIIKGLGHGVFANVAQAQDTQTGTLVAIKIVRRNDAMRKASQKEIDFLKRLNDADPSDRKHIVRFHEAFDHKFHLAIVFELLAKNLRELLKEESSGHGLSIQAVKMYARQMFSGLKHLQDCSILHSDIKPDNILVSMDRKQIKIADLGTAVDHRDNQEPTPYLVSRFYRAPEVILGMNVSYGIDMWAVGCTIYELWTGKILFPGRSNNGMVKSFMETLGWPSEKLLRKGSLSGQHFEVGATLVFASRELDQFAKPVIRTLEQSRMVNRSLKTRVLDAGRGITVNGPTVTELNDFADLLGACLNWNVEKRISPKEALVHKLFGVKSLTPRSTVVKPVLPKRGMLTSRK